MIANAARGQIDYENVFEYIRQTDFQFVFTRIISITFLFLCIDVSILIHSLFTMYKCEHKLFYSISISSSNFHTHI